MILIKLGGSIITAKQENKLLVRKSRLHNIGKELQQQIHQHPEVPIILVHGVGPFGHLIVKEHNLKQGYKTEKQKQAVVKTMQLLEKLNSEVRTILSQYIPTITIHLGSSCTAENGKLKSFGITPISAAIEQRIIPVLYGTLVLDTKQGCAVLSGDQIIRHIAQNLSCTKIIFLTDVDGVYTTDPRNPNAALVEVIENEDQLNQIELIHNKTNDVTGSMRGKVEEILQMNAKTIIANGTKKHTLTKIFANEQIGTTIIPWDR